MIVIVGGGISGLALAWELQKRGKEYLLLESADRFGGIIDTKTESGYLLDTGPNTLLADATVLRLIEEIGLTNSCIFPQPVASHRFIYRNGRFHGLSPNPLTLLTTRLVSWRCKRNIWKERSRPVEQVMDETLAHFFRRRFDEELLDWVVSPVQAGIFAGHPEELLVEDVFPRLAKAEREYGSVVKGMLKSGSAQRAKTLNFTHGMKALPETLASKLSSAHCHTAVTRIESDGHSWKVTWFQEGSEKEIRADAVVCCLPAFAAAPLLVGFHTLSQSLQSIKYAPMVLVHTAMDRSTTGFDFRGFGGLIPAAAPLFSSGSIWTSSVFAGRVPGKEHLLAQFVGGALGAEKTHLHDSELLHHLNSENRALYQSSPPIFQTLNRWERGIPQYNLERKRAEEFIVKNGPPGLHFLANWRGGVGISDCIRNAIKLAEEIALKMD